MGYNTFITATIALLLTLVLSIAPTCICAQNESSINQWDVEGAGRVSNTYMKALNIDTSNPSQKDWTDYPVIAHALGSVAGRRETNSKEALDESYERGQRVFEVDLQLTSDGCLVCRHDWDQNAAFNLEQKCVGVMSQEEFLKTPICYYYTPLNIDRLVALMTKYPDMYIVTDSKETDENSVRAEMRQIVQAIDRLDDHSLWDRIVVQIYHDDMYAWVSEETPVTNWIYTLYQIANPDYEHIGKFCKEHCSRYYGDRARIR